MIAAANPTCRRKPLCGRFIVAKETPCSQLLARTRLLYVWADIRGVTRVAPRRPGLRAAAAGYAGWTFQTYFGGRLLTDIAVRAQHRVAPTKTVSTPPDPTLPVPPDDRERDSYLQNSHRWVPVVSAFGGFLTTVSLLFLVRSQAWAIPLLIPLAITTTGMIVSLVSSVRKRRDTLLTHRHRVRSYQPSYHPSVDVFLPSAGEDLAVLANTFLHVSRLQWAGPITVYVLDDSARESVRELAWEYGFYYLTRPNRGYLKKAGNLRFGYEHSTGDFIAIFDADFVPRPDYLRQLMPYTTEEDVAIVQSPQYFDTHPKMNWVQFAAGATQILFYRWVSPPGTAATQQSVSEHAPSIDVAHSS
jgi:Glycosyl transferase family 2